jgi:hypothetical protein
LLRNKRPVAQTIRDVRVGLMTGIPVDERNVARALEENRLADSIIRRKVPSSDEDE